MWRTTLLALLAIGATTFSPTAFAQSVSIPTTTIESDTNVHEHRSGWRQWVIGEVSAGAMSKPRIVTIRGSDGSYVVIQVDADGTAIVTDFGGPGSIAPSGGNSGTGGSAGSGASGGVGWLPGAGGWSCGTVTGGGGSSTNCTFVPLFLP